MGNEKVDLISISKPEKRTLLQRYNIPIDNLSYEFISGCTNEKLLERIVLILRSGEEGVYPDLTKHAEERLASIKPNSTILRKAMPVLRSNMLNSGEQQEINNEINNWTCEMQSREKDLDEGKITLVNEPDSQPEIRKINSHVMKDKKTRIDEKDHGKIKRISSCDYAAWDKYDADTEVNRIDLQDEQRQVEMKRIQERRRKESTKMDNITTEATINKLSLTGTELNVMAEQEREKGNEAFRATDYQQALQHYNNSIMINSNLLTYNNRAMTFIKLQRYEDALNDCNTVLSMDYTNVKALLRRALCLEHLEKMQQALVDYEAVLKLEPINKIAISSINKLREPCKTKKIRMKIQEENISDDEVKIEQIKSKSTNSIRYLKHVDSNICYCDRAPSSSQNATQPHAKTNYCVETKSNKEIPDIVANKNKEKATDMFLNHNKQLTNAVKNFSHTNKIKELKDTVKKDNVRLEKSIFSCISTSYKGKSSVIIEELPNDTYEEPNKVIDSVEATMKMKKQMKTLDKNMLIKKTYVKENEKVIPLEKRNITKTDVISKNVRIANDYRREHSKMQMDDQKLDNVESPYEFLRKWQSLKNDINLKSHAILLRSIAYEDMNRIIGNKLDATMFSLILRCLAQQFCTPEDTNLLTDILYSLSRLSRFSIVYMFMDSMDKKALENIFYYLEQQGSSKVSQLRQMYST